MTTMSYGPLEPLRKPTRRANVATIGTFDGVHRGHLALIAHARQRAEAASLPLIVVTFDPPPAAILRPDQFPGAIEPIRRKVDMLHGAGADDVIVLPFTAELAQVTASEFMDTLAGDAAVHELYVGEGFALGHKRLGTVEVLASLAEERGMRFAAIPRVEVDHGVVSSSQIRRAVQQGNADGAAALLGRWFRVEGEVIHGAHVGRTIGFPTANVLPEKDLVQLADGIYASLAYLPGSDNAIHAMTYIGTRPALNTGGRLIETHLLDFDGDLYGQILVVDFVKRIRADADFPSLEDLVAQLRRDEAQTRAVLAGQLSPIEV